MAIFLGDTADNGSEELLAKDAVWGISREDFDTPTEDGTADEFVVKITSAPFGGNIMGLLFDSDGNLIANTASTSISIGVMTIPLESSVALSVANAPYRMALWASQNFAVAIDSSQTRTGSDRFNLSYTGSPPATLPAYTSYSNAGGRVYLALQSSGATPTISNVDGDNAVNQGQLVNINVADFTETITAGDIGGVAFESIPDNDPSDNEIQVRIPVTLTAGTYDVTISGDTETDTISGVTYTVTHQYEAPYGLVHPNSLSSEQVWTEDTYVRIVTSPANGTIDTSNPDWLKVDVRDVYTADSGFAGEDTITLEALYSGGTTAQWTPTIAVPAVVESVDVPTADTYAVGDDLSFTVNFSGDAYVTGTPAMNLTIGESTRQANYASGSSSSALVFTYTVQSGDEDADGIEVASLTLDGGTIQDSADNDANLTLNSVGDTSGVLVDGVAPVISINPLTTLDTSPIVSGSAGDATSLTLVVDGETYNPTPSGGSWSQQLPTLALGDYTMTLNGEDANGNAAIESSATLSIVNELSNANSILQPVLKSILSPIFEDVA